MIRPDRTGAVRWIKDIVPSKPKKDSKLQPKQADQEEERQKKFNVFEAEDSRMLQP